VKQVNKGKAEIVLRLQPRRHFIILFLVNAALNRIILVICFASPLEHAPPMPERCAGCEKCAISFQHNSLEAAQERIKVAHN
jgi:hypothetical protein